MYVECSQQFNRQVLIQAMHTVEMKKMNENRLCSRKKKLKKSDEVSQVTKQNKFSSQQQLSTAHRGKTHETFHSTRLFSLFFSWLFFLPGRDYCRVSFSLMLQIYSCYLCMRHERRRAPAQINNFAMNLFSETTQHSTSLSVQAWKKHYLLSLEISESHSAENRSPSDGDSSNIKRLPSQGSISPPTRDDSARLSYSVSRQKQNLRVLNFHEPKSAQTEHRLSSSGNEEHARLEGDGVRWSDVLWK